MIYNSFFRFIDSEDVICIITKKSKISLSSANLSKEDHAKYLKITKHQGKKFLLLTVSKKIHPALRKRQLRVEAGPSQSTIEISFKKSEVDILTFAK